MEHSSVSMLPLCSCSR